MNFRMNDLSHFMTVSDCPTMTEAAKKLGISQPSLSESIQRLETDLQCTLFYRSRSGLTLTPMGDAVRLHGKHAFSFLSEIEGLSKLGPEFGSRVITIGCHPTVASYCLPEAFEKIQKIAPDYKINLRHGLSRNVLSEIQSGQVDIGLVVNPTPSPDLVIRAIGSDQVCVWKAAQAGMDRVFCNLDLVQTQSILRKWKSQPANKVNSDSLELITRMTGQGLGYGILPERAVALFNFPLRIVENTPRFQDTICLVYRPEFGKSALEKELVQVLRESM